MSWQCPYDETVNQDAVPYCTVCGRLAPVIESFLSLEQIENISLYNDKLDKVHQYEFNGQYENMLATALEAIRLYKENGLAVAKVRVAVKRILENDMAYKLIKLIDRSLDTHDFSIASNVAEIWETLLPDDARIKSYKIKISEAKEDERQITAEAENLKQNNSNRQRKFPRPIRINTESVANVATHETLTTHKNKGERKFPKVKRNT